MQKHVEDKWQMWRGNGTPGHQFVIPYSRLSKRGDFTFRTPYEIVFETDGTIMQKNKSTHVKRAVRRLIQAHHPGQLHEEACEEAAENLRHQ